MTDPDIIMQMISTLGFPIIMVGVLLWYIYKIMNPMIKALDEIVDRLDDLEKNQELIRKELDSHGKK